MYMSYMLYQAERGKSVKDQREIDEQAGRLAAGFGRRRGAPRRRRASGRRALRQAAEDRPAHDACSCPSTGQQPICG